MAVSPTVVLVHGAWHDSMGWQGLQTILATRGIATLAVDLPSSGSPTSGLADDARALRELVDSVAAPVIVVAHSYGGVPATEGLVGAPNVRRIVYLAASMFVQDESQESMIGGLPPNDGQVVPPLPDSISLMYGEASADLAAKAADGLRPQSLASFTDVQTQVAWRGIPSTYMICTKDALFPPKKQEAYAGRATETIHLPCDHAPFISAPHLLADAIMEVIVSLLP